MLLFGIWLQLGWGSAVRSRRKHKIEYRCLCCVLARIRKRGFLIARRFAGGVIA